MRSELRAILDVMLPGGSGFPSGAETGAADWLIQSSRFAPAVMALISVLPKNFASSSLDQKMIALKMVETDIPDVFDAATVALYSAYYTQHEVLQKIEAARGYKARPPQPGGYNLPEFDPAILKKVMSNKGLWRDTEAK